MVSPRARLVASPPDAVWEGAVLLAPAAADVLLVHKAAVDVAAIPPALLGREAGADRGLERCAVGLGRRGVDRKQATAFDTRGEPALCETLKLKCHRAIDFR